MGNQRMLVIIFMYLEAKAVEGFKEVERVGNIVIGTGLYTNW